ncbi:hypothetical protein GOEFS_119_00020 [Gordonia effusa NBRC 100432]|uniref:Uncharacterized protein n=1 Tax=Gordonia effusa NBRC 100432 TaxID=1077974 RepID=H0R611_9ACTN|nr:hypothetical protein [Gordonia effusa]GAB20512.1 hypothetical protein GOEFS_119_00020 [Gordonia effusa NBRC 100432]
MTTQTDRWRASIPELPPLTTDAARTAESLLLLLHYSIDWDSWLAERRKRYWDELLPSHIRAATYRAVDSLPTWWSLLHQALPMTFADQTRRLEIATLLAEPGGPVLAILRDQLPALLLRVRIIADAHRTQDKTVDQ